MNGVLLAFLNTVAWMALVVSVFWLFCITAGRLLQSERDRMLFQLHGRRWRPMTPYALAALLALAWLRASGAL